MFVRNLAIISVMVLAFMASTISATETETYCDCRCNAKDGGGAEAVPYFIGCPAPGTPYECTAGTTPGGYLTCLKCGTLLECYAPAKYTLSEEDKTSIKNALCPLGPGTNHRTCPDGVQCNALSQIVIISEDYNDRGCDGECTTGGAQGVSNVVEYPLKIETTCPMDPPTCTATGKCSDDASGYECSVDTDSCIVQPGSVKIIVDTASCDKTCEDP
eukprot:TRINITY_DN414_c0_g2_i2.p1 TRINITY_DN414_c0_g2~~TRINITY_DN414_c0_g2_i2.p1  ORF type:complete len:216 (-),score=22.35 TRINITY_DN414_c0_g2_i2:263-910(-)